MEDKNLTPAQEPAAEESKAAALAGEVKEELAEVKEDLAEMTAGVREKLTGLAEEIREEAAEVKEELTEAVDELKEKLSGEAEEEETDGESDEDDEPEETEKQKKKKARKNSRLFIGVGALEWLSTLSFCGVILYLGYLMGLSAQAGAHGFELVTMSLTNWYSNLQLIALALFGVLYVTLAKKHSARWLAIPSLLYIVTAVWISLVAVILPGVQAFNTVLSYISLPEARNRLVADLVVSILPRILPYIIQTIMVVSFCIIVFGRGCRWVHLVWCAVWTGWMVYNIASGLSGTFVKMAPQLMLLLAMVATGALFALPAFVGKKVPKYEMAALRAADLEAYAAGNGKKKAAEAVAETDEAAGGAAEEAADAIIDEAADEETETAGETAEE